MTATKKDVIRSLNRLDAAFPQHKVTSEMYHAYYEVLKEYEPADIDAAVMRCLRLYNSYPSVAVIIKNMPVSPVEPIAAPGPAPFNKAAKELVKHLVEKVNAMPAVPKGSGWKPEKRAMPEPKRLDVDAKQQAQRAGDLHREFSNMAKSERDQGKKPLVTEREMQLEADREWQQRLLLAREGKLKRR